MFTARNPRWWLRAAGGVGVVAVTAALLAGTSARHGQARPGPGGGADPRLDAAALAVAAVASTAVLLLLRRPAPGGATDARGGEHADGRGGEHAAAHGGEH
ncbi:hypothetical protein [Streptomyces flavofungini]|uniref:Uncharacterized protein n=1 Tax=Streptomyces flavofungini TaxID=68200 RepID=A0ABS0XAR8_9ACTN|nr:hypothetical protein [Streptomyces flavofungini]MBJ3810310.1 hypothetical protein [Streptomyces flavofungini]